MLIISQIFSTEKTTRILMGASDWDTVFLLIISTTYIPSIIFVL
jgi:hypothetical protein